MDTTFRFLCPRANKNPHFDDPRGIKLNNFELETCICRDRKMCHYFWVLYWGCFRIFGYFLGLFLDLGVKISAKFDLFIVRSMGFGRVLFQ